MIKAVRIMSDIRNRIIKFISFTISLIIYMVFILIIDIHTLESGYKSTILLPFVFLFCFFFFLWDPVIKNRTPFILLFTSISFVRYVLLSVVIICNGYYAGISGVSPSPNSINLASILMSWELLITSILIRYWSTKKINIVSNNRKHLVSYANPIVYVLYICLIMTLLLLIPQSRQGISFFTSINRSVNDEIGSLGILGIREAFITSKYFLLFLVIIWLNNKNYLNKNKLFSYYIVIIVCTFIIGLRIGVNRKQIIGDAFVSALLLRDLFPKYRRTTVALIALLSSILFVVTTINRGMADSTTHVLSKFFDANFLQSYFLGQYNVAIAIEAKDLYYNMIDLKTYFFSLLRPLFGIGEVVKKNRFQYGDRYISYEDVFRIK